jgi:Domain of unknown function (DUF5753)
VQDRDQRDRHRLGEVQQAVRLAEDGAGVAEVGVDVLGGPGLVAVEQRAGVREHHRVNGCSHRQSGVARVMREQIDHLISVAELKGIVIQVLPFSVSDAPGVDGPAALFEFDDSSPPGGISLQAGLLACAEVTEDAPARGPPDGRRKVESIKALWLRLSLDPPANF